MNNILKYRILIMTLGCLLGGSPIVYSLNAANNLNHRQMKTKKCTKCNEVKDLSNFNLIKKSKDNHSYWCKSCINNHSKSYHKTEKGLLTLIYNGQISSSKQRGHDIPNYTKLELFDWITSNVNYKQFFLSWVSSDYKKELKPSCDRLNDYLPYTLDNLRLVVWDTNRKKAYSDMKNGINNKQSKSVLQYDLNGVFIKEHYSGRQAMRETNARHISGCCNLTRQTSGGYIWKFNNTTTNGE